MRLTESSLRIALFRYPTTVCDERSRMIAISSLLLPAADQRRHSETQAAKGEGDKGDRRKKH